MCKKDGHLFRAFDARQVFCQHCGEFRVAPGQYSHPVYPVYPTWWTNTTTITTGATSYGDTTMLSDGSSVTITV